MIFVEILKENKNEQNFSFVQESQEITGKVIKFAVIRMRNLNLTFVKGISTLLFAGINLDDCKFDNLRWNFLHSRTNNKVFFFILNILPKIV